MSRVLVTATVALAFGVGFAGAFGPSSVEDECPVSKTFCLATEGCGYCVDSRGHRGCIKGNLRGPALDPRESTLRDCETAWLPGMDRPQAAKCLMVVSDESDDYDIGEVICSDMHWEVEGYSDSDTRQTFTQFPLDPSTYSDVVETCPPRDDNGVKVQGRRLHEAFVVRDQEACDDYAKVLKRARATPQIRKDTHNKVGEYLLNHGAKLAAKKKRHDQGLSDYDDDDSAVSREGQNKMTRQDIGNALKNMGATALASLEEGACDFVDPAGAAFCQYLFNNPIANFINGEIMSLPLIGTMLKVVINTCMAIVNAIPILKDIIVAICELYNLYKNIMSAVYTAARSIFNFFFGWL